MRNVYMLSHEDLNEGTALLSDIDHYQAPKPSKPWKTWAKLIAARVFFPPVLLWDAAKAIMNSFLGETIGEIILPAQDLGFREIYNDHSTFINRIIKPKKLSAQKILVSTHDNANLDTLEIKQKNDTETPVELKKYIIRFVGNGICYEQYIEEMIDDANNLNCNVIGFNYRGVSHSTGKPKSKNDLVTDGIAQVQRLLNAGVNPENITLKGHSLGGGVSALVAKHFLDHGIFLNAFNNSSFSSLTNFVVGQIRTFDLHNHNGHHETFGMKLLGWIAKPFIKFAICLVKWEIEAADAFKALPDTHKEYMVVRSSKARREEYPAVLDDPVIPHYTSMHTALKGERSEQKQKIDEALEALGEKNTYALIGENLQNARNHLIEARNHLKERKMITRRGIDFNGHAEDLSNLVDRFNGGKASEFFIRFVNRAHTHHENMAAERMRANHIPTI